MPSTDRRAPQVGDELPNLTKQLGQRRIDAYSGVRPHSIHTDPDWAAAKGFRAPLAQAMMSTAFVSELMTAFLGEGFVVGGTMSVNFLLPVYAGDQLTVGGRVAAVSGGGEAGDVEVTVDVWCRNQDGQPTMAGTASGRLRAASA